MSKDAAIELLFGTGGQPLGHEIGQVDRLCHVAMTTVWGVHAP